MINCLCCYVIKSAGEIAKRVLLSIFWNVLLIEKSLKLGYRTVNARKYVRCASTFYFLNVIRMLVNKRNQSLLSKIITTKTIISLTRNFYVAYNSLVPITYIFKSHETYDNYVISEDTSKDVMQNCWKCDVLNHDLDGCIISLQAGQLQDMA